MNTDTITSRVDEKLLVSVMRGSHSGNTTAAADNAADDARN